MTSYTVIGYVRGLIAYLRDTFTFMFTDTLFTMSRDVANKLTIDNKSVVHTHNKMLLICKEK